MKETNISQNIRIALSRIGVCIFRNNVGALKDQTGRLVRYGLFTGSGDLIGWRSTTITPDMVGQSLAVFVSVEVKRPGGTSSDDQRKWRAAVEKAGGIAGIVYSVEDAIKLFES